jgi:DNA-binding SARP family transcriptional activator/tetratricopeptide (TPR) repeat protein
VVLVGFGGSARPAGAGLRFRLLGPVQALVDDRPMRLGGPGVHGLLAMLLLEPNQVVSLDRIVDVLWAHEPPATARTIVQGYVSRLRQRLAEVQPPGVARIVTIPPGYQLVVDASRIDVSVVRSLVARARGQSAARRAELLREAQSLWRGPELAGIDGRVRAPELTELRLAVMESRIDAELELGEHDDVIAELTALVDLHPFREHLVSQLVLALYRSGRRAAALTVYRRFAHRAAEELGIDPGPGLQRLHERILRDDASLTEQEQPVVAPRIGVVVPAQLPASPAGFGGRADEVAVLDSLLTRPDAAAPAVGLVVGPAGIGKTALAVTWARRMAAQFPDGQLFAVLRGFDGDNPPADPATVLSRFLVALGVPETHVPRDIDDRTALYRSLLADKRVLVVLDDVRDSGQVRPLLPSGPSSVLIATSRARLAGLVATSGARQLTLGMLSEEAAVRLIEVTSGRKIGVDESDACRALAELCGRLPLALRIAGARLAISPDTGIQELVEELTDEHTRLAGLDLEESDTSVRAALDISHRALEPRTGAVFRLLGLFPGPWIGPHALAAMLGGTPREASQRLRTLHESFMVDEVAPDRFALHDLVLLHARGLAAELSDADATAALRRLSEYYLVGADTARRQLSAAIDELDMAAAYPDVVVPRIDTRQAALDWFDQEWLTLLVIVEATANAGEHGTAWRLARLAGDYRAARPRWDDWFWLLEIGLSSARIGAATAAPDSPDRAAEAWLRLSRCTLFARFDRLQETVADAELAVAIATTLRNAKLMSVAFNAAASAQFGRERYEAALAGYTTAHELAQRAGHPAGSANAMNNIAQVLRKLGRLNEAIEPQRSAVTLLREVGDFGFSLLAMGNLAELWVEIGELAAAEQSAREVVGLAEPAGMPLQEGFGRQVLARVLRDGGDLAGARVEYERSVELFTDVGSPLAAHAQAELAALPDV